MGLCVHISATRMVAPVDLNQMLPGHMRVDLRRADIGMAQHDLNGPQVGAPFQQMAGKAVSQAVGSDILHETTGALITL